MSNKVIPVLAVVVAALSASMLFVFATPRPEPNTANANVPSAQVNEDYQQVTDGASGGNVNSSVTVETGEVQTGVTVQ